MATTSPRRPTSKVAFVAVLLLAACGGDDDGDPVEIDETIGTGAVVANHGDTLLAVVGDGGELSEDTLAVAAIVDAAEPGAVFTVGDNEYTTEGRTVEAYAESVGGVYGRYVDAGVFYPIPGDHDYGNACDDENAAADLEAYLAYFDLPVGPEDETYYDVRIHDVHVFALDTLIDCHRDGGAKLDRERAWLAEVATASDARVKIVLVHQPPYSSGTSHGSFEDLRWEFGDWGIDLVVAGDDHIFERSEHDGVTYVVNGLGGVEAHRLSDPIDGSEVLFADAFGALLINAADGGAIGASFVTVDGEIIDTFQLAPSPLESSSPRSEPVPSEPPVAPATEERAPVARLRVSSSWAWQLQGAPDAPYTYDVYDLDLFETTPATVTDMHDAGRVLICYFSAGSYEGWRPDADRFDPADLGETLDGFEDERWLDIRSATVRDVMVGRLDQAVELGCDGVEPDNVDGYANDNGVGLTADDQLDFNRFLADAAANRKLLVGLKNDLDQIPQLVDVFDFAVNEQCHQFDECEANQPFIDAGKPVFNAEYATKFVDDPDLICDRARALEVRTLILPLDLDGSFRISCDER